MFGVVIRRKPKLRGGAAGLPHTQPHLRHIFQLVVSNLGECLKRCMHIGQLRQERSFEMIIGEE